MRIVTDMTILRKPCEPVRSVKEGGVIARQLWAALEHHNRKSKAGRGPRGIGLAAPQIGISKQVCVLDAGSPLVLMNPRVVGRSEHLVPFQEGCLSLPGQTVETYRHIWVEVECLNHPQVLSFGPKLPPEWVKGGKAILQSVVVQHEVSHLAGLLIDDFTSREDCLDPLTWMEEKHAVYHDICRV